MKKDDLMKKQDLFYIKQKRLVQEINKGLPKMISATHLEKLMNSMLSTVDVIKEMMVEAKKAELLIGDDVWVSVSIASKHFKKGEKTIERWCRNGVLTKVKKVGKAWRIHKSELS